MSWRHNIIVSLMGQYWFIKIMLSQRLCCHWIAVPRSSSRAKPAAGKCLESQLYSWSLNYGRVRLPSRAGGYLGNCVEEQSHSDFCQTHSIYLGLAFWLLLQFTAKTKWILWHYWMRLYSASVGVCRVQQGRRGSHSMCVTVTTSKKTCVHFALACFQVYSDYKTDIAENSRFKIDISSFSIELTLSAISKCSKFSVLSFSICYERYLRGWKEGSAVKNTLLNHKDGSLNPTTYTEWLTNTY